MVKEHFHLDWLTKIRELYREWGIVWQPEKQVYPMEESMRIATAHWKPMAKQLEEKNIYNQWGSNQCVFFLSRLIFSLLYLSQPFPASAGDTRFMQNKSKDEN